MWRDDECNTGCNSTNCRWDGYDCESVINVTSCLNSTDWIEDYAISHQINNKKCNIDMINNGWCDLNCKNSQTLVCSNYEINYNCNGCPDACGDIYTPFELFDTNGDFLWETSEICDNEDLYALFTGVVGKEVPCTNVTNNPTFDLNQDGYLSFYEVLYTLLLSSTDMEIWKIQQIDCSGCLNDPNLYY